MFRLDLGATRSYCDGMTRRNFVQLGMAGMASIGLPQILRAKEASAEGGNPSKKTSIILLWLDGGPSHLDLYDLKPQARRMPRYLESHSHECRRHGDFELFPQQAKCADKFSLIRSLHHGNGDHFTAGHFMLTGRGGVNGADNQGKSPFVGSIATKLTGPRKPGMPLYVAVPYGMSIGLRPGYFGANYVGASHNPFETEGDPNAAAFQVPNIQMPGGMSVDRLDDRATLAKHFDRMRRDVETKGMIQSMDRFDRQAIELVTGNAARTAFDISLEDPRVRDRYGRHSWGQSTLLARRLVEAGSTFVTVHFGGWDHHWDLKSGMERYLPIVDTLVSALLEDLSQNADCSTTFLSCFAGNSAVRLA